MLVSNTGTVDFVSSDENNFLWKKYVTLPQLKQDILTDVQLPEKLVGLQKTLGFSDVMAGMVSLCVRKVFFGEMNFIEAESFLAQALVSQGQSVESAKKIIHFIQEEILTIKPKPEVELVEGGAPEVLLTRLPLLKALSEYPRLGEQQITTEKIRVKSSPDLVRPSLANWIRYYRDELGIGFHDQVTRGKFLFQSENGKKLGNDERERINLVLKSLEEDFPLDIDTDRMVIVFPLATPPMVPQGRGLQDQSHPGSRTMTQPSKLSFPTPPQAAPARPVKPFVPTPSQAPSLPQGTTAPKTAFFGAKFGAAKNVAGETLHFSTGHVLPSEKSGAPSNSPPANLPTSAPSVVPTPSFRSAGISQSRGTALPRSPYSIRPLRMRDDPAEREMDSR